MSEYTHIASTKELKNVQRWTHGDFTSTKLSLFGNWASVDINWHILIFITHLMNENDLEFLCYKFFKWSTSVLYWTMDKCTSIGKGVDLRPAPNSSNDADETETWTIYLFIHCIYVISLHTLSLSLSRLFNLHLWLHAVTHFAKKNCTKCKKWFGVFFLDFSVWFGTLRFEHTVALYVNRLYSRIKDKLFTLNSIWELITL